ncbi:hypothetical protein F3I16_19620 [Pseudomonas sp. L-22-4S-12]|uniref:hypothetical protein n=1 Tax=Pseudomonas sp. L-22-4S-12 TaxID=2610893 RepID=UPI0013212618|nr:hypothetical protein [Pseudomonas sp. L-22-4S-12]MWV18255.1 hypothetical protein [Pseudomonas sp. L-22-4S-12]
MHENKIPFGERDGTLFRAHEVENGLRCGCVCPGCQQPLNAANNGERVVPHFRHAKSNDCFDGFREGVRRAAVALLAQQKQLMLPALTETVRVATQEGRLLEQKVELQPVITTADTVERFVDLGNLRGHAVLHQSDRQLIIRIKLSARMEHERYRQLEGLKHSSMEIDLHHLTLEQINDPASFEHAVLYDPTTRHWIRSIRGERLLTITEQRLRLLASELNAQWHLEQTEREAAEKARQAALDKEKAELQLALEAHRARQIQMADEQPATEQDNTVQGRAELIAETMLTALQAWNGKAVECNACHLLSPPEYSFCLYCDAQTSKVNPVTLSPDIPSTIHKRMRCSAKPTMSMKAAPRLLLRPDLAVSASAPTTPTSQEDAPQ